MDQLEREIARAQISILPSDARDPLKFGVSHNRLVDSIRGGCVTIASPMGSYLELEELALLGNNFGELLNNAVENYRKIMGATNPENAEEGTIRKKHALNIQENSVHGSDSEENAEIEISFFFNENEIISN